MKLHLPVFVRQAVLAFGIFTSIASSTEPGWTWDSSWYEESKKIESFDVLTATEDFLSETDSHRYDFALSHKNLHQYWQDGILVVDFVGDFLRFPSVYGGNMLNTVERADSGSYVYDDPWDGGARNVWMHFSDGLWAEAIVGGNAYSDARLAGSWYSYDYTPQKHTFNGDVHIQIEEEVSIGLPGILFDVYDGFYRVVGGNEITYGMYDDKDKKETVFDGSSYISIRTDKAGLFVVGGNISTVFGTVSYYMHDTYVNIYNIQQKYITSEVEQGGLWLDGLSEYGRAFYTWAELWDRICDWRDIYNEEWWNGLDDLWQQRVKSIVYDNYVNSNMDVIVGGNLLFGIWHEQFDVTQSGDLWIVGSSMCSISEAYGNSNVLIDLATRSGNFEKKVVAGDFVTSWYSHAVREGETNLWIQNAGDVVFTECITAGSRNSGLNSSVLLRGNSHLYIDSGVYQSLVVGGMLSGDMYGTNPIATNAGRAIIDGSTNVTVTGGRYEGFSYTYTHNWQDDREERSIGKVSLVGGNVAVSNIERNMVSVITGDVNMELKNAEFAGHIVGGTAVLGRVEDFSKADIHVGGKISLKMKDSKVEKGAEAAPRVVGGMLLHTVQAQLPDWTYGMTSLFDVNEEQMLQHQWTSQADWWYMFGENHFRGVSPTDYKSFVSRMDDYVSNIGITLGDVEVEVRGSKGEVYDVVGGSWVGCAVGPKQVVKQGNISVTLGSGIVVKGNVYAGGIQAGEAPLSAESTAVNVEAGVKFDAGAVVSGGFLCTDQQQNEEKYSDAFCSWRERVSKVKGARSLRFTSEANYGENLSGVIFTNFDEVKVSAEDVKVGALILTDTQEGMREEITLSGGGRLSIAPGYINASGYEMRNGALSAVSREQLNLAPVVLTDGTTLHLAADEGTAKFSTVQSVKVTQSSTLWVDLAPQDHSHRELLVQDTLQFTEGSTLELHVNLTSDSAEQAFIHRAEPGRDSTIMFDNATIELELEYVDTELRNAQGDIYIVLVDKVLGDMSGIDFIVGDVTLNSLSKHFKNKGVRLEVDTNGRLVLTNKSKLGNNVQKPEEEDKGTGYHEDNATSGNGKGGGALLDEFFPDAVAGDAPDRKKVEKAVFKHNVAKNYSESDRILAAMAGASISVVSNAMSTDLERQLRMIRNRAQNRAMSEIDDQSHRSVWVSAESDYRHVAAKGTAPGYKMNSWGGTLGMDYTTSRSIHFGLALTAMYGDLTSKGPDSLKADTDACYLSAYTQMRHNKWTHTLVVTAGLVHPDGERTVYIGEDFGSYSTLSSTHGHMLGALYEVGRSFYLNAAHTAYVEPIVHASWRHVAIGGFAESGSDAALSVSQQTMDSVELGAGFRVGGALGRKALNRRVQLEGRALVKAYFGDTDSEVCVGFRDRSARTTVRSREQNRMGVELGGSATLPLRSRINKVHSLFVDTNADLRGDYTNLNANVGYKVQF